MADISQIKLPNNVTYDIKDINALPLTGGSVTGPVSFGDSVSIDEATIGDLVVSGSASFTNNLQANTINGVEVGSNPKFTDTVTTATTTGSGNAVTAVTVSNGALTITKGTTFLTSHQDISGKADKSATVSTITYDSTNKKITKTINGTTSDVVTVATLKTALGSMPASDVYSWAKASTKPSYAYSEITGTVPSSALPSYVDDVLEYSAKSSFPTTGETGKIYVDTSTNLTWRWGGSTYVEISPSLALGTTSSTAYRGDYGNTAYTHATDANRLTTAKTSGLYKIATTAHGHVQSVTAVAKADITALGIPAQDTTYESKAAASGGTAVSLVTTGEKYTWNNKISATTPTIATDTGTSTVTLASAGKYKLTAGGGSVIFTMPTIPTVDYPVTSVNNKTGAVSLSAADVGALASNTTYVSKITTTAGAHTAISNKSGAVSFNVPTKTSHLTNDSGFLTSHQDISGKVNKSGDTMTGNLVVPAERIANTYYGVSFGRTTSTPVETILYTGIKWVSSSHMPVVHITGYAYGLASPVEFKVGFYIYNGKIGWCGVTNMGSWAPDVYLFKYARDGVDYVAVGFAGSCYFLQLSADVQDEMGKFNNIVTDSSAWSWSFLTTAGTIPTPDNGVTCIKVPYTADILNPTKVNGHTVNSDVPANAKFTDTVPTTTNSKVTGITASTTATKTTLGTAFTIPNVTSAGSASTWAFEEVSIPNVTAAGSASTWAFEDIACDDITSWSAGSGSASISGAVDSSDSTQLNITISHTHTAPSLSYTARTVSSKKSGANGSAPTLGTAIKVQSKKSGANGSAPTLGTAFTVPNVTGNTSATVSITDPGHTHSI